MKYCNTIQAGRKLFDLAISGVSSYEEEGLTFSEELASAPAF